jgi:2Fe-2S ferredoxin
VTAVRVEPAGVELEVAEGETVMAAAERAGYRWPTVCGGQAQCGVCALEVLSGGDGLSAPAPLEAGRLAQLPEIRMWPERTYRLACQLRVPSEELAGRAGVVVRKKGVVRGSLRTP